MTDLRMSEPIDPIEITRPGAGGDGLRSLIATAREHAADVDRQGRFPGEALSVARRTGLLGFLVPVAYGGQGGTLSEFTEAAAALGAACQSTAYVWTSHCQQVDAIVRHGSEELRAEVLPRVSAGEVYLGSVTTEAGGGGHLLSSASALRETHGRLEVHREAPIVTGGRDADAFLIKVRSSVEAPQSDLTLVYADRSDLTIETTREWDALGMRGVDNVALTFSGTVDRSHVVGDPGGFAAIALESFAPLAHLGWSATWLGATRAGWASLLAAMRRRTVSQDARESLTKERMARIRSRLEVVSAYLSVVLAEVEHCRQAGLSLRPAPIQIHLNTLKVLAAEECLAAALGMLPLGGLDLGYRKDSAVPLERLTRDLAAASLTYSDIRLLLANGALSILDGDVTLATARVGTTTSPT